MLMVYVHANNIYARQQSLYMLTPYMHASSLCLTMYGLCTY